MERGDLHHDIDRGGFFGELALLVSDSPRDLLETQPGFVRALLRELAARLVQASAPGTDLRGRIK